MPARGINSYYTLDEFWLAVDAEVEFDVHEAMLRNHVAVVAVTGPVDKLLGPAKEAWPADPVDRADYDLAVWHYRYLRMNQHEHCPCGQEM